MSVVSRVLTTWQGAPVVGGGVTVMHCTVNGEHDLMAAYRAFLDSIKAAFPIDLQWAFPPAGDIITQENGHVAGTWVDDTPVSPLAAAGAATWANGVGVRIKWTTDAVFNSHRVVGSTFLVPLVISNYEGAGNIVGSTLSAISAAASTFVAAAGLRVYCRPQGGLDGQSFAVNGFTVPDQVSWLRGRRT